MLNRRFVILWIVMFMSGVASTPVLALFSVYSEAELQQPPLFAAINRALFMLAGGLFAIAGGALCDYLGRKRTFLIGLTGTVALAAVFFVRDPVLLFVLFLYAGIATGLFTTAGQTYLMAAVPQTTMGLATAVYFLGYTLSSAIGNDAVGRIVDAASFNTAGIALFVLALLTLVGAFFTLPSLPLEGQGRAFSFGDTLSGYKQIAKRSEVALLMGIRFIPTLYWGMATLLIPLLIYRATQSTVDAARYASLSLLMAAGFQLLTGRVLDKVGYRLPVLIMITVLPILSFVTAIFATSVTGLFVTGVLGAMAAWSLATTIPGLVRAVADEAEQGRILGATEFVWSLSMMFGNLIGGRLVDVNAGLPFWIAGLLLLPAIPMAWRLCHLEFVK